MSIKENPISRRDFLKVTGLVLTASTLNACNIDLENKEKQEDLMRYLSEPFYNTMQKASEDNSLSGITTDVGRGIRFLAHEVFEVSNKVVPNYWERVSKKSNLSSNPLFLSKDLKLWERYSQLNLDRLSWRTYFDKGNPLISGIEYDYEAVQEWSNLDALGPMVHLSVGKRKEIDSQNLSEYPDGYEYLFGSVSKENMQGAFSEGLEIIFPEGIEYEDGFKEPARFSNLDKALTRLGAYLIYYGYGKKDVVPKVESYSAPDVAFFSSILNKNGERIGNLMKNYANGDWENVVDSCATRLSQKNNECNKWQTLFWFSQLDAICGILIQDSVLPDDMKVIPGGAKEALLQWEKEIIMPGETRTSFK